MSEWTCNIGKIPDKCDQINCWFLTRNGCRFPSNPQRAKPPPMPLPPGAEAVMSAVRLFMCSCPTFDGTMQDQRDPHCWDCSKWKLCRAIMDYDNPTVQKTWFKCSDCGCTWHDDADNCFGECQECGREHIYSLEGLS